MPPLSDDRVREYQKCYLRAYGHEISFAEARQQAEEFAAILRTIYLDSDNLPSL